MILKVGDCIEGPRAVGGLICQILVVRSTGYTWRYLVRDNRHLAQPSQREGWHYTSDVTSDPFFDDGWTQIDCATPMSA